MTMKLEWPLFILLNFIFLFYFYISWLLWCFGGL